MFFKYTMGRRPKEISTVIERGGSGSQENDWLGFSQFTKVFINLTVAFNYLQVYHELADI